MFSNVYIAIQSNQFHELLSLFVSYWRASCSLAAHDVYVQTIAATLCLYMWLTCYVFDIVRSTLNFAFHEQNRCPCPCVECSTILCSAWLPTTSFHSALVPAVNSTEVDSQVFQAHKPEVVSSLWDFSLDKGRCHKHQPFQEPLDFNMEAERELREIIALAPESVPVQCDHHH